VTSKHKDTLGRYCGLITTLCLRLTDRLMKTTKTSAQSMAPSKLKTGVSQTQVVRFTAWGQQCGTNSRWHHS